MGAEPLNGASNVVFKNFKIDADYKVGFCVYGTYLTHGVDICNIKTSHALEHNIYIAKSWYSSFSDFSAERGKNCGITFGIPLELLDGTKFEWTSGSSFEINNSIINNMRAQYCGQHFSVDNPGTFTPYDTNIRNKGYGIGYGIGNSFNASKFYAEGNGGVGLYCYTSSQPVKTLSGGYLEKNCLNSGLDVANDMAQILIENKSNTGGSIEIKDIFCNFDSGGIFHTGVLGRKVWLRNVRQPRFLKSLDGLTTLQLYSEVLKDSVYTGAGYYNTLDSISNGVEVQSVVDTKDDFEIKMIDDTNVKLVYIRLVDGTPPHGSMIITQTNGETSGRSYPADLTTDFKLAYALSSSIIKISKSGDAGSTNSRVEFKIVKTPRTDI